MSIKIVTIKEAIHMKELVQKYNECFEEVIGNAIDDYVCDNSGVEILRGTKCSVIMVLPTKNHPNYEHQKEMLSSYVY